MIVPHTVAEFEYELPSWLRRRSLFVGPIVRRPNGVAIHRLREKYSLASDDFVLVTTAGGGGLDDDARRLFVVAEAVHRRIGDRKFRHIVVRGPNSALPCQIVDQRMTVVDTEPDLVSLFAISDLVVSAGGYNSVNEIRLTKAPAMFVPGKRKYDDQTERVRELAECGLAWVAPGQEPDSIANQVVVIVPIQ